VAIDSTTGDSSALAISAFVARIGLGSSAMDFLSRKSATMGFSFVSDPLETGQFEQLMVPGYPTTRSLEFSTA
jgi:hypothetical protein